MQDYDVIVVGAGNAALAAAVSAHENGAKQVLVLEKAPRDMRGGNTHWAGAVLRIAFDDPHELEPLLPGIEEEYERLLRGHHALHAQGLHGRPAARHQRAHGPRAVEHPGRQLEGHRVLDARDRRREDGAGDHGGGRQEGQHGGVAARAGGARGARGRRPVAHVVRHGRQAGHRDPLFQRRHRADPRRPRPHLRRQGARAGRARDYPRQGGGARLRRLRGQRADAHAAYRPAGRRRQGARHAAQPGRRAAHGDGDRRHAVGAVERLPRHADQRRLGRVRAARVHRPLQPAELSLRPDDQPPGPPLRRRGRGPEPLHLRQVRPRDPGRARCQGLPAVRQQGAAPAGAALFDVASRSSPSRSRSCWRSSTSTTRSRR